MKTVLSRPAATLFFILCFRLLQPGASAQTPNGTYKVTEQWQVRLEYDNWGPSGFTGTKTFQGTQSGTVVIQNGQYTLIDKSGVNWGSDQDLTSRSISFSGAFYINGSYPFAPAFGSTARGIVFLGCFVVSVPLIDGEVPAFYSYDDYSASGSDLSSLSGSGNMVGSDLGAYVSSTITLSKVVGPPAIVQQPTNQTVFAGQDAAFRVVAGGDGVLGYLWRKGSAVVVGATGPSLRITNVQPADAAAYSVVVSNSGGTVTSSAAKLTVNTPPAGPWFEGFESAPLGSSVPSSNNVVAIHGDRGYWTIGDTMANFPDCAPDGNHADIVNDNSRKLLRLVSAPSASTCAQNVWAALDSGAASSLPIPLLHSSDISFFEQGAMDNPQWNGYFGCVGPPCGDTISLEVTDSSNNQVVYIFQRATNYIEHALTNGPAHSGYREIFLDQAGGIFTRNLYQDLAAVAGPDGPGLSIVSIQFSIASSGWAELDDLNITLGPGTPGTSPLTVTVSGSGRVSPDLNGQSLQVGSSYKITATPDPGNLFVTWTGSITSAAPSLTFTMLSNMVLQANFSTNSFIPLKGAYYGLFSETDGVRQNSSGYFSSTITATKSGGGFSAKIQIGSSSSSLSGAFDISGHAHGTATRKSGNPLTVDLQLDFAPGADRLTGAISDGNWTAHLLADRAIFSKAFPCTFAAKYTILFPGKPDDATLPAGDSFATITVDANGKIKLAGYLADNTPISQSSFISKNGEWPLYIAAYTGAGLLEGWMSFANLPNDELVGVSTWIKPADATAKFYPLGFSNVVAAIGSIYHPPVNSPVIALADGSLALSGTNPPAPLTNSLTLTAANKILTAGSNKFSMNISLPSGSYSGSVTPPTSKTATPFKGVLLQNQNVGGGFFLSTNLQSGPVYFGP